MARLTPTVNTIRYSGVQGDRRTVIANLTIAGTYTTAAASDGGALLTPAQLGLTSLDAVVVSPTVTADSIEEQPLSVGPSTSTTAGWVFALTNKDDDLVTPNSTAVTGVTFDVVAYGR